MRPIITLTTDFGTADGYVGEVKGVLLSHAPDADIVDITHDIPPQDADRARLTVARIWRRFPEGSIHLVIVDPVLDRRARRWPSPATNDFSSGPTTACSRRRCSRQAPAS